MRGDGIALFQQKLTASKVQETGDNAVELDPATIALIMALLQAAIPMIQQCFTPKPAALRRKFLNRAKLAVNIMRETGLGPVKAFVEADRMLDIAQKASDEELQMVIDDCCSEN